MNARSQRQITRRRITAALEHHLNEHSATQIAGHVDCSPSQVHRRGPVLGNWPLSDALSMAEDDIDLREALIDALQGPSDPPPEPIRAIPDFHLALKDTADLLKHGLSIVEDGKFDERDKADARKLRLCIRDLIPALRLIDRHCAALEARTP